MKGEKLGGFVVSRSVRMLAVALVLLMLAPSASLALPAPTLPLQDAAKDTPRVKTEADFEAQAAVDSAPAAGTRDERVPLPDAVLPADEPTVKATSGPGVDVSNNCTPSGTITLSDGVASQASIDVASTSSECDFIFTPSGLASFARITLPPTTPNDFDLYVKKGSAPTTTVYDCRPFLGGSSTEQCDIVTTDTTPIYVAVIEFSGSGLFNVTAINYTPPPTCGLGNAVTALTAGTPVTTNLTADGTANCQFTFTTPGSAGTVAKFFLDLTGATNYDLYVRATGAVSNTTYDCRPLLSGTANETCNLDLFQDTTYNAMVRRGSSSAGTPNFTLTVTTLNTCNAGTGVTALTAGTAFTTGLTNDSEARCFFSFVPDPAAGDIGRYTLNLTTQNFDVLVKKGLVPTNSTSGGSTGSDCAPRSTGTTNETCDLDVTDTTTLFAQVRRGTSVTGAANFSVTPSMVSTCSNGPSAVVLPLATRVQANLTTNTGAKCYFKTSVLASQYDAFRTTMNLSSGQDFDTYVRRNAIPATSVSDCSRASGSGVNETCDLDVFADTTFFSMIRRFSGSGQFNVTHDAFQTCSLGTGTTALADGVAQDASLLANAVAKCYFSFQVPATTADQVKFTLSGMGTGVNFDLHVRKGALPNATTYDCRPLLSGNATETCTLANDGSTYFAMVRMSSTVLAGSFTITAQSANTCSLGPGVTALAAGSIQGTLSVDTGARCLFSFAPNALHDRVNFTMNPPPTGGDFDLYVRKGAPSTSALYDCRPFLSGNATETCELDHDGASTWFVNVSRFSGNGTFTLSATSFGKCSLGTGTASLADGVAQAATLLNFTGAACRFSFTPAPGADVVTFDTAAVSGSGNVDLYVKKGAAPTTSSYDCAPLLAGNTEHCDLANDGSVWFVLVNRASGSASFTMTAASVTTCSLGTGTTSLADGVATPGTLANFAGSACRFGFVPSPDADLASVQLVPPAGSDFDLYVKKGAMPTSTDFDCRGATLGDATESCDLPSDGTQIFILVLRVSGSGAFSVTASSAATCSIGFNVNALAEDVVQTASLTGDAGAKCYYSFNPLAAQSDLGRFIMTPPAGSDFDLYVKKGSLPSTSSYDCLASHPGDVEERCEIDVVDDTPFYAMVRRVDGSGEFSIRGTSASTCGLGTGLHGLVDSVTTSLTDNDGAKCYFSFAPDAIHDGARFDLSSGAGTDFDLYTRKGDFPSLSAFDCKSSTMDAERCEVQVSDGTALYVMVRRVSGGGDFSLAAAQFDTCSLGTGLTDLASGAQQDVTLTANSWAHCRFRFLPDAAGNDGARFTPSAGSTLLVRKGAAPTSAVKDCTGGVCELQVSDGTAFFADLRGSGAASLTAADFATCSLGIGRTALGDGASASGSITANSWAKCLFSFAPSTSNVDSLRFSLGPSGAGLNLYARKGADATPSLSNCSTDGSAPCEQQLLDGTFWDLTLLSTGASSFSVTAATFSTCSLGAGTLQLSSGNVITPSLTGNAWAQCLFQFTPDSANNDGARFTMTPPSGANFDLYVRKGSPPTTSTYDCRPLLGAGSAETCEQQVMDGTSWFGLVKRSTGSGQMSLSAQDFSTCSLGAGVLSINGQLSPSLTANTWAQCRFTFTPDSTQHDGARFRYDPSTSGQDYDLYVKKGSMPTTSSYDCRPFLSGAVLELCENQVVDDTPWFALVKRFSGSGAFTMTGQGFSTCGLGPGVHDLANAQQASSSLTANTWAACRFRLPTDANADFADFVMTPATSDFDLYVKHGAVPTASSYDCAPFFGGNATEQCTQLIEDAQPWFAMVKRFSGSGSFSIAGTDIVIPALDNGVPQLGSVAQGAFQYWKVVVPAGSERLGIAVVGDPAVAACAPANPLLGTDVCKPADAAELYVCATSAFFCPVVQQAKAQVCSVQCTFGQDADLYVRHGKGLPTMFVNDCASRSAGSVDACLFDTTAADLPAAPPLPVPAPGAPLAVKSYLGGGKYFIGVRGSTVVGSYAIAAVYVLPALPALPALPDVPALPPVPAAAATGPAAVN